MYEAPIEEIEDVPGAVQFTPDDSYILYENEEYYFVGEIDGNVLKTEIDEKLVKELEDSGYEIRGIEDEENKNSFFDDIIKFTNGIY